MPDSKKSSAQAEWEYYSNKFQRAKESIARWTDYVDNERIGDTAKRLIESAQQSIQDCIARYPFLSRDI